MNHVISNLIGDEAPSFVKLGRFATYGKQFQAYAWLAPDVDVESRSGYWAPLDRSDGIRVGFLERWRWSGNLTIQKTRKQRDIKARNRVCKHLSDFTASGGS